MFNEQEGEPTIVLNEQDGEPDIVFNKQQDQESVIERVYLSITYYQYSSSLRA